jgi:hypothetical protein
MAEKTLDERALAEAPQLSPPAETPRGWFLADREGLLGVLFLAPAVI